MSILDDIRQRIADAVLPSQKRGLLPYDRMGNQRNIGSVSAGNETEASLRGTVFACLQHRANALSAIKFNTFKEQNFDRSELGADHWASRLLANPNPYFVRSQIYSYIENWLSINGNAFIWTPTNGYHVPLQMWVLNPTRVRIIKGSEKFVDGYIYQSAQDGNIHIPEREMVHLARIHPAARPEEIVGMNMLGVGLVTAALEYANIDREVSAYLQRLFENNTVPPLIAEHPDTVDRETWERIRDGWNEALPKYKLRALLHGGMKLNLPPKGELAISYDAVSADTRSQIAQVFGVPPGMLTGEFQNRATAEVQFQIFRQNTIDPEALYIAEELTRHFRRFEEDVLIEPEPYVYKDLDADLKQEEFQLRWGIKTINEARADRGYLPVQNGDVPLIAQGFLPLDMATGGQPQTKPAQISANAPQLPVARRSFPYNTNEARADFWRNYDGLTTENQFKLEDVTATAISELKKKITDKVNSGQTQIGGIELSEKTTDKIQSVINDAVRNVSQTVATQLEGNAVPLDGEYGKALQGLARESADKITESMETIKTEMAGVIQANAMKDKSELLSILTNRFDTVYSQSRLRTIANTVSANVTAGSQLATYKRLGYTYIWLTEQDNRVRPSHQIMEGKEVDPDGFFSVPVMKKGITDEGAVGEIIVGYEKTERPLGGGLSASGAVNCRCQLFPVQRQTTETVTVQKPSTGTSAPNAPSGSNLPRVIAGGRGGQLKAVTDFEAKYRNLKTHEMGMVTDYDGNVIAEVTGEKSSVSVYKGMTREQMGALTKAGNTVLTHNHPSGSSFSPQDILNSMSMNRAECRAVGSEYTYVLQRPKNGYKFRQNFKEYWESQGRTYNEGSMSLLEKQTDALENDYEKFILDIQSKASTRNFSGKENFPDDMHDLYDLLGTDDGEDTGKVWREISHIVNQRMAKKYKYIYERLPNE
jgi:HK97 family phage portal protein